MVEARAAAALIQNEYYNRDILVTTPYQKQKDLIIRFLRDRSLSDRVRTVDPRPRSRVRNNQYKARTNGLGFMNVSSKDERYFDS